MGLSYPGILTPNRRPYPLLTNRHELALTPPTQSQLRVSWGLPTAHITMATSKTNASSSSLSTVVSNLVRAQMGSAVSSTVTDEDLDRHIAELILKEAKQKAEKYGREGVKAYLPHSGWYVYSTTTLSAFLKLCIDLVGRRATHPRPTSGSYHLLFGVQMTTTKLFYEHRLWLRKKCVKRGLNKRGGRGESGLRRPWRLRR